MTGDWVGGPTERGQIAIAMREVSSSTDSREQIENLWLLGVDYRIRFVSIWPVVAACMWCHSLGGIFEAR